MQGDRYSHFVAWLKIVLPLGALALFATMALFAGRTGDRSQIPYAEIEAIARDPRITAPSFSGVTEAGSAVTIAAEAVRPMEGTADAFVIADFRIELVSPAEGRVEITATEGAFDGRAQRVTLDGLARIVASGGYEMETQGLIADLRAGLAETQGALEIRAPYGRLTAGGLILDANAGRLVFNGGVSLLYQPQIQENPP